MTAQTHASATDADAIAADLCARIEAGERRALARAITLVESTRADHRAAASALMARLYGRHDTAIRIGLSGTPGVGKSTFIESLGMMLVNAGLRVAVLAVDPSSTRNGGSILGDKTRMELLSRHRGAFIRPSPSRTILGGVGRRTRESIMLCEAAGFDVVLVETVGVGQSETMVADMTDVFVLLMAPAGGDELQGVKRGIMEICDMILVNKADGDLKPAADRTRADYAGALRLLRGRGHDPEGFPKALSVSALLEEGLASAWEEIRALDGWRRDTGVRDARRREQAVTWMRAEIEGRLTDMFRADRFVADLLPRLEADVAAGAITPDAAAATALAAFKDGIMGSRKC
jgi:LAO/AO transport system kinase